MLQKSILLSELKHSPTNVRKVKGSDSGFKSLCASIKAKGLLHNLVVVKNGKGYNVIDGNRRLDALNAIYENSDDVKLVSCIVVDHEDDELGLHANMMREDMHPLDECDAINALVADGSEDFDSVAGRFGQTKRWVEQRVGLSDLSDTAKEMFRQNKFGIGVATALTLGSIDKQNKFLEENKDHNLTANWVKSAMTGGKVALSSALFPTDSDSLLAMPDLDIESDLFSEDVFITNLDAFIKYQDMELQKIVQTHRDEGYMDVVLLKDEYWFDSPAVRGFTPARDEKFDTGDMIMVISYNTFNYRIYKMQMITREMNEQEQANLEQQEAEEQEIEVTPMLMTKPQENLLNGYYGTYAKAVMYEKLHKNPHNLEKLSKSLIVHRRLGYTYSGVNRIGNVFADYQKQYPVDEEPNGYTTPEHEEFIEHHIRS
jgi:ParB/RepB/Spo0J family partition protein